MDLGTLLEQERDQFTTVGDRWKPTGLLFFHQARTLLLDVQQRYDRLLEVHDQLMALDRFPLYSKSIRQQRLLLRKALFSWKDNQFEFLRAVTAFYVEYAMILHLLRQDQRRGLIPSVSLSQPSTAHPGV